jgi:hypothetical protein
MGVQTILNNFQDGITANAAPKSKGPTSFGTWISDVERPAAGKKTPSISTLCIGVGGTRVATDC